MTDAELAALTGEIADHGFLSWLDLRVEHLETDRAVLVVPDHEKLRNVGQNEATPIHGGVLATLIDSASAFALRTTFEDPTAASLTTTNLDVSYLRPATGDLRATADVVRAGGSMGVTDVEVTAPTPDGEDTVAVGSTTYRLFRGGDE
ncbi:hotdog fold thioesterase [Salinarchaeum chitinilyticum]